MRAGNPDRLTWRQPRTLDAATFAMLRPRFDAILASAPGDAVYSVNSRTIYRVDDADLGPLAVKELRFETRSRQLRAAWLRRHRIMCEFHAADVFALGGGVTPRLYGAAQEWRNGGLCRVFVVMQWLADATTLTRALPAWPLADRDDRLAALARALVEAAETGLVHGRHSSENILVTPDDVFHTIDFSHAQLYGSFHRAGFTRDVARIGARLRIEDAASTADVDTLFRAVVAASPPGSVARDELQREFETILAQGKRRQKFTRNVRTLWRGFPFRLRARR